jgi:hypothetical protein
MGLQDSTERAPEEQPNIFTPWQRIRANVYPTWLNRDMRLLLFARVFMSTARALAGIIVPIYLVLLGFNALTMGLLFHSSDLVRVGSDRLSKGSR